MLSVPRARFVGTLVGSVLVGRGAMVAPVALVSLAMGGALAYDGPFWAAASEAMPVAYHSWFLLSSLVKGNLRHKVG
jgi:hypothetical protein